MTGLYRYRVVTVHRVIDGDTVDCALSLGFGVRGDFRFRVAGVDTPEIYGRYAEPAGQEAAAFTRDWLAAHAPLVAETYKGSQSTVGIGDGAFGRWLADFIDETTDERLSTAIIGADL